MTPTESLQSAFRATAHRPSPQGIGKLLQSLAAGDQVLATRIDRLASSCTSKGRGISGCAATFSMETARIGVGVIEIEVLFKGRFSDVGLPGAPPV